MTEITPRIEDAGSALKITQCSRVGRNSAGAGRIGEYEKEQIADEAVTIRDRWKSGSWPAGTVKKYGP